MDVTGDIAPIFYEEVIFKFIYFLITGLVGVIVWFVRSWINKNISNPLKTLEMFRYQEMQHPLWTYFQAKKSEIKTILKIEDKNKINIVCVLRLLADYQLDANIYTTNEFKKTIQDLTKTNSLIEEFLNNEEQNMVDMFSNAIDNAMKEFLEKTGALKIYKNYWYRYSRIVQLQKKQIRKLFEKCRELYRPGLKISNTNRIITMIIHVTGFQELSMANAEYAFVEMIETASYNGELLEEANKVAEKLKDDDMWKSYL